MPFWVRLILFSFVVSACTHASAGPVRADGTWWRSAATPQRVGYAAGYLDCAVFEAGHRELTGTKWHALEKRITQHYSVTEADGGERVGAILMKFATSAPRSSPDPSAEHYPGKHGMFDGEYWRQSNQAHRLGFVVGFLDCWVTQRIQGWVFSRPAEWYIPMISEWYGIVGEDPGVIREDRSPAKIADVLRRFAD